MKRKYSRNDLNHFWISLWYPKFHHQINAIPSCWSFIDNELKTYRAKVEDFDENHDQVGDFYFNQVFANNMLIFRLLSELFLPLATAKHPQSDKLASTTHY